MIHLLGKIPQYWLFRSLHFPHPLPINLTVSITYRCNSRCKTCRVYNKRAQELSLEEYKKIFSFLRRAPYWITISGGEPFLRNDITEICNSAIDLCRPSIINIPTNGILSDVIIKRVSTIAQHNQRTKIIVNISLDDIGSKHDEIRGVKGNFDKALQTFNGLKHLNHPNLAVGIHTVISRFNVEHFSDIVENLLALKPDSFICEIAEKRKELETLKEDISPPIKDYSKAIQLLRNAIKSNSFSGISKLTQAFRIYYYGLSKEILEKKRQIIPCYAGFASAQIAPDGDVWMCCIKAASIGNLRDADYNFKTLWLSRKADEARAAIKNGQCSCPLANATYTNMLLNVKSLIHVGLNYLHLSYRNK
jgi:MoaA/NifB/PqqE/SkfB family radical SAM enzyme